MCCGGGTYGASNVVDSVSAHRELTRQRPAELGAPAYVTAQLLASEGARVQIDAINKHGDNLDQRLFRKQEING